jgi:putative nucleotide binding protein
MENRETYEPSAGSSSGGASTGHAFNNSGVNPSAAHNSSAQQPKRYEEHAHVLDFIQRGKSTTVRGREGIIIQAIGEERLTLLELLGMQNMSFEVGERLYIGREGRDKVMSVLGRLEYNDISQSAKNELPAIVEKIVITNEKRFIDYINTSQPITPRIHALELIPGIGKTYMMAIIKERDKKKFENFADLQARVGLRDPAKLIAKRIIEEIMGEARMNLFVRK